VSDASVGTGGSAASPGEGLMYQESSRGWGGWIAFGATMAILIGILHVIAGLTALFNDEYYVVTKRQLVVSVDYTAWGWVHLLFGILAIATGFGMLKRALWARIVGVFFASLSIVVNLAFLNAQPAWSSIVIAFDVLLIWALTVHGDEVTQSGTRPMWSSPYGPS
jgi:vacuolar-type H+-ATPase subunit I/STV1